MRSIHILTKSMNGPNRAPVIAGLQKAIAVPFGGTARLSAEVSDDGLPGQSQDIVVQSLWQIAEMKVHTYLVVDAGQQYNRTLHYI